MEFPRQRNQYVIAASGDLTPDGVTIHRAKHVNPATDEEVSVGIKIFDVNKIDDIYSFTQFLCKAKTISHDNIVKIHCSFVADGRLWVVTSPPGVQIRSILRSDFRQGLPEKAVAFILKETLNAVHYMHERNKACRNLGAGCVSLDDEYRIKIAVNSFKFEDHGNGLLSSRFIRDYKVGEDKATDVLMFGFLALELFYGKIPSSDEFGFLVANEFGEKQEKLEKFRVFSCFRSETMRIPPRAFAEVIAACFRRDPDERPTTNQLMERRLFQTKFSGNQSLKKLMNKRS